MVTAGWKPDQLRGGTKRISHIAFSDLQVVSRPHFTADLPQKGLKMTLRGFSSKIIFQNLTPMCLERQKL